MKIFGVFDADFILTLPFLTGWLWAVGGTGQKVFRKFGVPIALTLYAWGYGVTGWPLIVFLAGILVVISFGPGYGDRYVKLLKGFYWPYIFTLGAAYNLCQFGIVLHSHDLSSYLIAGAIGSVVFGGGMLLSKKAGLPWKIAEGLTGACAALPLVLSLQ